MPALPPDLENIRNQFVSARNDAERLAGGLSDEAAAWRPRSDAWTVAQCLDHLAVTNRMYTDAMSGAFRKARRTGKTRKGPVSAGLLGGAFAWTLEPPITSRFKAEAPAKIKPRPSPPLDSALNGYRDTNDALIRLLEENADLEFNDVTFPNPFVSLLSMNAAQMVYVIAAHDRRHLWQGWQVRNAIPVSMHAETASL